MLLHGLSGGKKNPKKCVLVAVYFLSQCFHYQKEKKFSGSLVDFFLGYKVGFFLLCSSSPLSLFPFLVAYEQDNRCILRASY